jgi:hypothetical protein
MMGSRPVEPISSSVVPGFGADYAACDRAQHTWLPQDKHLVRGLRLLLDQHGAPDRNDQRDDAVDAFGGFVLGRLEIAGGASFLETISFSSSRVGDAI